MTSKRKPPMQNIPIRTEEGKAIRKAFSDRSFLPPLDYAALEIRLLKHEPFEFFSKVDTDPVTHGAAEKHTCPFCELERQRKEKADG